ncbi:MAG: hypothetical protein KY476_03525 [Planctomycetes bacterium]|nr:hypothetical protein [Planctomycetota bacterium]
MTVVVGGTAIAAEPAIRAVSIRGLRIGATTTLTVDGSNLVPEPRLLAAFPIAKVELKSDPPPQSNRIVLDVTLGEDVVPGMYPLRVVSMSGVSAPIVIGVDRLPQVPVAAKVETLPAAVHGTVAGSAIVETTFDGKAGQEVTIEVEAQQLAGALRPVLHVYDSRRLQLGWAWPTPTLFGDCRLKVTLPADDTYTVALHDAEYAAQNPNHFRLKIGTWAYADQVFPAVVERGKTQPVEILGNGVGAAAANADVMTAWLPLDWPDPSTASGLRPAVRVVDLPEVVEQPAGEAPQVLPAIPVAVSGRIAADGEEDRYRLAVSPGMRLKFEIIAERRGSPLDSVLVLRNDEGAQLARGEDGPETTDTVLEYAVPANVAAAIVAVSDLHGRGGPRCVYRLLVEQMDAGPRKPHFRLFTPQDRLTVASDGFGLLPLHVERAGFDGPITLSPEGLPPGMTVEPLEIAAGAEGVLLNVAAQPGASAAALVQFLGTAEEGGLQRIAEVAGHPLATLQPWLASDVALARGTPTAFRIEWGESPSDAALVLAGKLPLPVRVMRPEGEATPVRLALITSQNTPLLANNQPDPNKALRAEAAVEIAPDKTDGELALIVPPELAGPVYDIALRAELLSKDKQTVLATAFTPPRRLRVVNPVGIELTGPPKIEAVIDPKTPLMLKITGSVVRRGAFTGDVALALEDLPGGVAAVPATVKADATAFEIPVTFPANFQPREVTAKLVATTAPNPQQANVKVRSNVIELTFALSASAAQSAN